MPVPPDHAPIRHELIQRVFRLDILVCPCGGRLRTIAVINHPDITEAIGAAIIMTHQQPARGPPPKSRAF